MCAMCRMFWTTTHCQAVFPQPPVVIVTLDGILQGQKCLAPEINTHTHKLYTSTNSPVVVVVVLVSPEINTHTHKLYTSTSSPVVVVVVLISLPQLQY